MARARLDAAARRVGAELVSSPVEDLEHLLEGRQPDIIVLDLDAGGSALLSELERLRSDGVVPARVVGYFSHVDDELAAAASRVGVEAVPRGRFWRELPQLLEPGV